jgi:histidinol-phosphate aminotransferase
MLRIDKQNRSQTLISRRTLTGLMTTIAGVVGGSLSSGSATAQTAKQQSLNRNIDINDPAVIRMTGNENPMGPCPEAIEAIADVVPFGWRYADAAAQSQFIQAAAKVTSVPETHIAAFAGTSDPLRRAGFAFTSASRGWVLADPGYPSGPPQFTGAKTISVPLRADLSHDVEAMLEADPRAGVYFVCNPNNPTGTLTARKDIEYLLTHKQKDGIVLVDEAYIEYTEEKSFADLVLAGRDIIILRTFSKIYGMAGLRAGYALGRPDLLAKLRVWGDGKLPVTGLVAATASLHVSETLVPERRALNQKIRENTFRYLDKRGIPYIPSLTNYFVMEVNRPAEQFVQALAEEKIITGRIWKTWPTKVRITIGTQAEMDRFTAACDKVLAV